MSARPTERETHRAKRLWSNGCATARSYESFRETLRCRFGVASGSSTAGLGVASTLPRRLSALVSSRSLSRVALSGLSKPGCLQTVRATACVSCDGGTGPLNGVLTVLDSATKSKYVERSSEMSSSVQSTSSSSPASMTSESADDSDESEDSDDRRSMRRRCDCCAKPSGSDAHGGRHWIGGVRGEDDNGEPLVEELSEGGGAMAMRGGRVEPERMAGRRQSGRSPCGAHWRTQRCVRSAPVGATARTRSGAGAESANRRRRSIDASCKRKGRSISATR